MIRFAFSYDVTSHDCESLMKGAHHCCVFFFKSHCRCGWYIVGYYPSVDKSVSAYSLPLRIPILKLFRHVTIIVHVVDRDHSLARRLDRVRLNTWDLLVH